MTIYQSKRLRPGQQRINHSETQIHMNFARNTNDKAISLLRDLDSLALSGPYRRRSRGDGWAGLLMIWATAGACIEALRVVVQAEAIKTPSRNVLLGAAAHASIGLGVHVDIALASVALVAAGKVLQSIGRKVGAFGSHV